jgi:hypothetical protein
MVSLFVSDELLPARRTSTQRTVVVHGCSDPEDVIDYVNTHRNLGLAIRVAARVLAGAAVLVPLALVVL